MSLRKAVATYSGVNRRFDHKIVDEKLIYIDDYAHHPKEIEACINSVKKLYSDKKVTGIFQPHLFSRTQDFADGFASSLEMLDDIILVDIYPAREKPIEGVTSKLIFDKIKNKNKIICSKEEIINVLKNKDVEVVLTFGAGDIDTQVKPIKEFLMNKYNIS